MGLRQCTLVAVSRSLLSLFGILFPKHTNLICIFNQCSESRASFPSCHPSFGSRVSFCFPFGSPGILFPREEFAAEGLPNEIRYSQFRFDCHQNREGKGSFVFLLHHRLFSPSRFSFVPSSSILFNRDARLD